jgi:hypothetical protein
MPAVTQEPLGRVRTIEDLRQIMRERAAALGVTRESIGEAALLAPRYVNTLLAPVPAKGLGVLSIPGLMEALQFELIAVPRTDVPKRVTDKLEKHRMAVSDLGVRYVRTLSKRFLRAIARKGGRARALKLGPRARRKIAKNAGIARWKGVGPMERSRIAKLAADARWKKLRVARQVMQCQ